MALREAIWRPAVFSIGHGNPEVNETIVSQLAQFACGYRYLFSSDRSRDFSASVRCNISRARSSTLEPSEFRRGLR
jgi:hypothetical protein